MYKVFWYINGIMKGILKKKYDILNIVIDFSFYFFFKNCCIYWLKCMFVLLNFNISMFVIVIKFNSFKFRFVFV